MADLLNHCDPRFDSNTVSLSQPDCVKWIHTGSEAGEKKIPESLGLAPGVVFLVCIILFQQLHVHNVASWLQWPKGKAQVCS